MAAAAAQGYQLFDSRSIGAFDVFTGRREDFEQWVIGLEAECELRGFGPLIDIVKGDLTQTIGPLSSLGLVAGEVSRSLYALFARRLRGKALTFVRLAEQGHGLAVLLALYKEYRPHGIEPDHGMLTAILNPKWWHEREHQSRDFNDVLLDWDTLVNRYEVSSGETVTNAMRCATILAWCPKHVENMLRSAAKSVRQNHGEMRIAIKDQAIGAIRDYAPVASSTDAMDVGAIMSRDGKGGKSKAGVRCEKCGRIGHEIRDCWHVNGFPSNKGKGKSSVGGAGAGKNQKDSTTAATTKKPKDLSKVKCYTCHEKGHYAKDCKKVVGAVDRMDDPADNLVSDDGGNARWCLAVEVDGEVCGADDYGSRYVMLDSGADEHCCDRKFGLETQLSSSKAKLRDIQKHEIKLDGERRNIPMLLGSGKNSIAAAATMQVGGFSRNLFSVGRLYDQGLDIVLSHENGCYITKGGTTRIPLERQKNTFGVRVQTFGSSREARKVRKEMAGTIAVTRKPEEQTRPNDPKDEHEAKLEETSDDAHAQAQAPMADVGLARNPRAVPDALLHGPGSSAHDLKERMEQLGQPGYDADTQLWTRLEQAEIQQKTLEKEQQALAEQQEADTRGDMEADEVHIRLPTDPPEEAQELHNLSHYRQEDWCEFDMVGQNGENPHRRVQEEWELPMPTIMADWGFTEEEAMYEDEEDLAKTLVCVDCDTDMMLAIDAPTKKANGQTVDAVCDFMKTMGYQKLDFRTAGEPNMISLQGKVKAARLRDGLGTVTSSRKIDDSQNMDPTESAVQWWRSKALILKSDAEANYQLKIRPGSKLWPWMIQHSSWLANRYRIRPDGLTAYEATYGVGYTSPTAEFAETVLVEIPESKARKKRRRARPKRPLESSWCKAIWVGKHEKTDEHTILIPEGVFRCRNLRRLVGSARWDRELLASVVGLLECEPIEDEDITLRLQAPVHVASPVPLDGDGDQVNASEVKDPAADTTMEVLLDRGENDPDLVEDGEAAEPLEGSGSKEAPAEPPPTLSSGATSVGSVRRPRENEGDACGTVAKADGGPTNRGRRETR